MKKFMLSPDEGARSMLKAATDPALASDSGHYYNQRGEERRPSKLADDAELARTLWAKSAEWTGLAG